MKYYADRNVTSASGTQTFVVEADTTEEAKEMFKSGKSTIASNDVEVTDLSDWDWDTLYSE